MSQGALLGLNEHEEQQELNRDAESPCVVLSVVWEPFPYLFEDVTSGFRRNRVPVQWNELQTQSDCPELGGAAAISEDSENHHCCDPRRSALKHGEQALRVRERINVCEVRDRECPKKSDFLNLELATGEDGADWGTGRRAAKGEQGKAQRLRNGGELEQKYYVVAGSRDLRDFLDSFHLSDVPAARGTRVRSDRGE
jgi:hypothetical protein